MTQIKIDIDLARCIKSGQCCYLFPELVRLRNDNFPEVVPEVAAGKCSVDPDRAEELVDTCPAVAIRIVESPAPS